jgi:hypothetical protein
MRATPLFRLLRGWALWAALLALWPAIAVAGEEQVLLLRAQGSNGYSIRVSAEGATAFLTVSRPLSGDLAEASSVYIARAKLSATRIRATFGELGAVSFRFRPSAGVKRGSAQRGCRGPDRFTTRFGVFVGRLDFEGENGYTAAHLHRVKGRVISPISLNCDGPFVATPQPRGSHFASAHRRSKLTTLQAGWRLGLDAASFTALDGGEHARFFASSAQSQGALAIYRFAFALASPLAFATDDSLSLAGVTPPPPFSGSASFQRDLSGSKSWTGSLAVSFPGAPAVPLTGSQFKAQLTRSW